jgi:adenylate cyclase, class 2
MHNHLETEVKFYLREIDPIRNAILGLGAVCLGRFFEINICFDDKKQTLLKKKALLRLRKDQKNTLTFKSRAVVFDPDVKVMEEIEVAVGDFDATRKILCALGFCEAVRYEKWRETFSLGNTSILIDSMPFGDFLEIEGEKQAIRSISSEIGLPWGNRILYNYLEIFETLKTRLQLPFRDITFENFKNCPVDAVNFIQMFYGPKSDVSVNRKS